MNELPLVRLIELVAFDQQVLAQEREVQQSDALLKDIEIKLKQLHEELDNTKNAWLKARRMVDEKELEMKALDDREKEAQRKLDVLQNPKEYAPLKKEIDQLKEQQHAFEQILIQTWQEAEAAERAYKSQQGTHEQKIQELNAELATKQKEREEKISQIAEFKKTRHEKEQGLPVEWLEKYAMMQSRVPNPVVPVINGTCSGCFYVVSPQDIMALRRRKLLQCKECYRFLYLEEMLKAADTNEAQTS